MIVVGCGKSKLDHSAPARELYTGSLFRMARRYAEASGRPWVILSGAHGVIGPDVVLRPYDAGPPERGRERDGWARKAAVGIEGYARELHPKWKGPICVLAGERYADPLCRELAELDLHWSQPLRGMGTGQRLQFLKREIEAFERAALA